MNLYNKIINKEEKVSLVGLGYVGMPIAVAFADKGVDVIGFDLNKSKIELYKNGIDPTNEVGDDAIKACTVDFTADESKLCEAKFHIVAVPTPVDENNNPDLTPLYGASTTVGKVISKGDAWGHRTGNYTVYCTDGTVAKDGTVMLTPVYSQGLAFTSNGDGTCYVSEIILDPNDCANVVIPKVRFPILFYSETPLGKIYGIYATDFERVDKCIWGMIGEHIYYALISPQFIEGMENNDHLHLILFSQP